LVPWEEEHFAIMDLGEMAKKPSLFRFQLNEGGIFFSRERRYLGYWKSHNRSNYMGMGRGLDFHRILWIVY